MRWNQINNQADIEFLLREYFRFHDSCIIAVDYISGAKVNDEGSMCGVSSGCALIIRFDSQMPSFHHQPEKKTLGLKFIGLRRLNLIGYQDNCFPIMSSCFLAFYEDFIVWVEDDCFNPENCSGTGLLEAPMSTFAVADRLAWRFV